MTNNQPNIFKQTKKGNLTVIRMDKSKGNFTQVSNTVILNKDLSLNARFILIYLLSLDDKKDIATQEKIAKVTNLSTRQVSRYLSELKKLGHVEIKKVHDKGATGQYLSEYIVSESIRHLPTDINQQTNKSYGQVDSKNNLGSNDNNGYSDLNNKLAIGHNPSDADGVLYNTKNLNTKDNIREEQKPKEKIVNFLSDEKTNLIKQLTDLKIFESVAKDLVFNYSSDIISKQLTYYQYREPNERNAGYLVNAIKNNQDMPDEYKRHLFSLSMKEFLNKHRPVMTIWRCAMGSNLEQLKENIVNPVLVQLGNLDYYRSISKETRPELDETYSNFFDEIQTKFLKTFEIISFKELIEMISEVKANNKDININSISKTISKIINKGV